MPDEWGSSPTHLVYCPYCDKPVIAVQEGEVANYMDWDAGPSSRVILTKCESCSGAHVFRKEALDPFGDDWEEWQRLWPSPPRQLSSSIPGALRLEHSEARKCLDAKAYTATVVMVRRTLEGVCYVHNVKERTLAQSLKSMEQKGLLDSRLVEWAQELRAVGNQGAHYTGTQVPREDAEDALAFSEALLDYVYVLTAKFNDFKERRMKEHAGAETPTQDKSANDSVGGAEESA